MSHAGPQNSVTGRVGTQGAILCIFCGAIFKNWRGDQRYCSSACYQRGYNLEHPVSRQHVIDWTPAAREHGAALDKRESKGQRILARLKEGSATTMELARVGGIRFGARILELRQAGHRITREDHRHAGDEWSTYTLEGE
jgi:hypothetical protein